MLGVFLTNKGNSERLSAQLEHETAKKRQELLRDRGEELYEIVDLWTGGIFGHFLTRLSVMHGKLTYNQALDIDAKSMEKRALKFGRIEMLVDVYLPELRADYDTVISLRDAANKIVTSHKFAYERGESDGRSFIKPFTEAQIAMEQFVKSFKASIAERVRAV